MRKINFKKLIREENKLIAKEAENLGISIAKLILHKCPFCGGKLTAQYRRKDQFGKWYTVYSCRRGIEFEFDDKYPSYSELENFFRGLTHIRPPTIRK